MTQCDSVVSVNRMRVIMARMSFATILLVLAVGCGRPAQQQQSNSGTRDSKSDKSSSIAPAAVTDDVHADGEQVSDLKIRLELESQDNGLVIEWDKPCRVVLINGSDRPIRMWHPDSEHGFDQFEVHFHNLKTGVTHVAKRHMIDDPEYWKVVGGSPESDSNVIEVAAGETHEGSIELGDV